jgi:GTP cyclohydrolase IA
VPTTATLLVALRRMSRRAGSTSAGAAIDRVAAAAAIDAFLRAIGRDDPEITGTGARVADMFVDELCAGYQVDTRALIEHAAIDGTSSAGSVVVVRDIPIVTTCPHHLLPSLGVATVAFAPSARIVGLGAVAALVEAHARRLALQEHIGDAVVDDLAAVLAPRWAGCRLVLTHGCMVARGERTVGAHVETIALRAPDAMVAQAHALLGVGSRGAR